MPAAIRTLGDKMKLTVQMPKEGIRLRNLVHAVERDLIFQALAQAAYIKTEAARLLSINRTTLIEKMKRYHIPLNMASQLEMNFSIADAPPSNDR
jgi:sigma-54 dependent transcriptional regulator, flagellar regulatory protein